MALPDDQPWKLNNTALKSLRHSNEERPGCPRLDMPKWGVSLFSSDTVQVHTLQRGDKTDYELVEPFQPWSWKKCSGHLTRTLGTRSLGMASRTSVSGHCGTVMTTSGITRGMMRTCVAQARESQRKSNLQFGISRSGARMEAGSDSTPARQKRNLKSLTFTASSRRRALRQGGGKATGLALSGG